MNYPQSLIDLCPVSWAALDTVFAERLHHGLGKREPLSPERWAEEVRRMEGGRRYRFDFAPYQLEPYADIFNAEISLVVLNWASRMGKTELVSNAIGYSIEQTPRRIIVAYPTESQAADWSKDNFQAQLVNPTPELHSILGDGAGTRRSNSTIHSKTFPGGKIDVVGLNVMGKLRKTKGDFLYADEIDAITQEASDEGDKLEVLFRRGSEFPDAIKIISSYPSLKGRSAIEHWMDLSDYRKWFVSCPRCSVEYVMTRHHLTWPDGEPDKAEMRCPSCDAGLSDVDRIKMMMSGRWKASKSYNGVRGYHLNAMAWPHPHQESFRNYLHQVAKKLEEIRTAPDPVRAERVFVNTFDAEPYEPKYEAKVEVNELQAALEPFDALTMLPAGVLVITLGADVQADRLELCFWGWGLESQSWLLRHEVVYGSPEHSGTWRELDAQTRREWTHPSGHKLYVQCVCIDAAYRQSHVMRYTSPRFRRNVFAVRGSPTLGKFLMESKPQIRGRPPGPVWFVGTNEAKDIIYQRLELVREVLERGGPGPGATFPHGYIHMPTGTTPDFLAQLTAEDSSMKQVGGQWFRAFENPDKRRNEALDMTVYALAAERYLNPQYAVIAAKLAPAPEPGAPPPAAKVEKRQVRKRVDMRRRWVV